MIHAVICMNKNERDATVKLYLEKNCTVHVYGPVGAADELAAEHLSGGSYGKYGNAGEGAYLVVVYRTETFDGNPPLPG